MQEQKNENMKLSPGVIDTIVSLTAKEQEGVAAVGNNAPKGFFAKFASKPSTAGIECLENGDGELEIAIHIDVCHGYSIPKIAETLRDAIANAIKMQAGLDVARIDVYVDGIQFTQN